MFNIKKKAGLFLRKLRYRRCFRHLGKEVRIYGKLICLGNNVEVGDYTALNEGIIFNSRSKITIGSHCHISHYVQIFTGELDLKQNYAKREHISRPVTIGDGVWLCAGSVITPGVTIGEGSVIAAGSVVESNVPPFEIWGGVPAKKIKDLSRKNK